MVSLSFANIYILERPLDKMTCFAVQKNVLDLDGMIKVLDPPPAGCNISNLKSGLSPIGIEKN